MSSCSSAFGANSSLSQGESFAKMTSTFHGGKRNCGLMRGGALGAPFPGGFDTLPNDMHDLAGIGKLDSAFNELPEFAGKYGMSGGKRSRKHRKNSRKTRKMRGGVAEVSASAMILSPAEAGQAGLHAQWTNENLVVPSYKGPDNALLQKAGKRKASRKSRKSRKAGRKVRKASRKGSRKNGRKASRKGSRKNGRKASRKNRK